MTHTPGPWRIETIAGREFVAAPTGVLFDAFSFGGPAASANARLIAAAPKMLEALKALSHFIEKEAPEWGKPWPGRPHAIADAARAAIAEAEK